jgi:hypothetical protein
MRSAPRLGPQANDADSLEGGHAFRVRDCARMVCVRSSWYSSGARDDIECGKPHPCGLDRRALSDREAKPTNRQRVCRRAKTEVNVGRALKCGNVGALDLSTTILAFEADLGHAPCHLRMSTLRVHQPGSQAIA